MSTNNSANASAINQLPLTPITTVTATGSSPSLQFGSTYFSGYTVYCITFNNLIFGHFMGLQLSTNNLSSFDTTHNYFSTYQLGANTSSGNVAENRTATDQLCISPVGFTGYAGDDTYPGYGKIWLLNMGINSIPAAIWDFTFHSTAANFSQARSMGVGAVESANTYNSCQLLSNNGPGGSGTTYNITSGSATLWGGSYIF